MSSQESDTEFLLGAEAILGELKRLGLVEDDADLDAVYYIAREQKLPIGKFGKNLISTRTKLRNAANNLIS